MNVTNGSELTITWELYETLEGLHSHLRRAEGEVRVVREDVSTVHGPLQCRPASWKCP